jgi:anti-sigma regulatory factor (Ser/Thr protein kinase)
MAATRDRSITLPAEPASIKRARDFVARSVAEHVDDPSEVLLMTSELVANVVSHVGSVVTITVRNGPVVRIEVHNHEAATQAFRDLVHHSPRPANESPTGRGLGIVRALASRIGLGDDPGRGKVVCSSGSHVVTIRQSRLVETIGIEPTTPCLQIRKMAISANLGSY